MTVIDETRKVMDEKLLAFEQRVDNRLQGVAASMEKLASSVHLLAERDIRMQERESQQQATNLRITNALENLGKDVAAIQLARADERHAMEAIKRAHPWILVLSLVGPILTTLALGAWFKSSFQTTGDQRAVIPLVQQYDPRNPPQEMRSAPAPKR
jgi:hypothetical protein